MGNYEEEVFSTLLVSGLPEFPVAAIDRPQTSSLQVKMDYQCPCAIKHTRRGRVGQIHPHSDQIFIINHKLWLTEKRRIIKSRFFRCGGFGTGRCFIRWTDQWMAQAAHEVRETSKQTSADRNALSKRGHRCWSAGVRLWPIEPLRVDCPLLQLLKVYLNWPLNF